MLEIVRRVMVMKKKIFLWPSRFTVDNDFNFFLKSIYTNTSIDEQQ